MKLPPHAKVGHRKYKIVELKPCQSEHSTLYGDCNKTEARIRINTSYGVQKARETLLHEVLHAIYYEWNVQDEDKEERVVTQIASGLTQTLADSPALREWFNKAWKL